MTHTTNQITILESNVNIFMERFIDAIKDGYEVQNTNYGWVSDGVLKEITLSEVPDKGVEEGEEDQVVELGEFTISEYDTQTFLCKVAKQVVRGGKVDLSTLNWDMVGIKSVKGVTYLIARYNKSELVEMEWEQLKCVLKEVGVTGRDRGVIISKYLSSTGQL